MKPYPMLVRSLLVITVPLGVFIGAVGVFIGRTRGVEWSFFQEPWLARWQTLRSVWHLTGTPAEALTGALQKCVLG
jgi:hypothetical protein